MKNVLRFCLATSIPLVVIASLVHPSGPVKKQPSPAPLLAGAEKPPVVADLIRRACANCHSEQTVWPWYSHVAPFSWLIERDVHDARGHMNLSSWAGYSLEQQVDLLTRIAVEVRNGKMPLPQYLMLHPEAKLSGEEIQRLTVWAHGERRRLKTLLEARRSNSTD